MLPRSKATRNRLEAPPFVQRLIQEFNLTWYLYHHPQVFVVIVTVHKVDQDANNTMSDSELYEPKNILLTGGAGEPAVAVEFENIARMLSISMFATRICN